MALTNNEKQTNSDLVILKPVEKDADKHALAKPFFSVTRKVNDKWVKTDETYTNVIGTLSKVEIESSEYKGDINKNIKLYLQDGEELYLLDLRFNMATRSLFNGLLALSDYNNLKISIYRSKKDYLSYYLRKDDHTVDWKFKIEELPTPTKVKFKGKDMTDFSEVDAFFEKELLALSTKLGGSGKINARTSKKEATVAPATEKPKAAAGVDEDVPF